MLSSNETRVGDLLQALSQECAALAGISERIQTIVGRNGGNVAIERSVHRDAQACDLLTQSLTAITEVLSVISQRAPQTWTLDIVDVLQQLPLSDLAAALSFKPKSKEASSGTIEFF